MLWMEMLSHCMRQDGTDHDVWKWRIFFVVQPGTCVSIANVSRNIYAEVCEDRQWIMICFML